MIEQDLQNRVKAALEALGIDGLVVCGNYIAANAGAVMGEETPDCKMLVEIVTMPRRADDYGWLCPISVQMGLSLSFRADDYPTGAEVAPVLGKVFDLVTAWSRETDGTDGSGALETDEFRPGGVRADGGTGPTFDSTACAWRATFSFTVRGRIKEN